MDQSKIVVPHPVGSWIDMVGTERQRRSRDRPMTQDVIMIQGNMILIEQIRSQTRRGQIECRVIPAITRRSIASMLNTNRSLIIPVVARMIGNIAFMHDLVDSTVAIYNIVDAGLAFW